MDKTIFKLSNEGDRGAVELALNQMRVNWQYKHIHIKSDQFTFGRDMNYIVADGNFKTLGDNLLRSGSILRYQVIKGEQ